MVKGSILKGMALETGDFHAARSVLMLFHSKFIALTLCGARTSPGAASGGDAEGAAAWAEAIRGHWRTYDHRPVLPRSMAYRIDPRLAAWMSPVL